MHEVAPRQLIAYVAVAILIGVVGARYARSALAGSGSDATSAALTDTSAYAATASPAAGADAAPATTAADAAAVETATTTAAVVVDVAGAVRRPGVYRLPAGARIDDAIRRAGGVRAHADLDPVNLAALVTDGQQIVVPRHGQAAAVAAAPAAGGVTAAEATATPATPVDLNTATAEQLETIDGVGPATAQKILAYRQLHGSFKSVEELLQVAGIGPKKLAAMRPLVRV